MNKQQWSTSEHWNVLKTILAQVRKVDIDSLRDSKDGESFGDSNILKKSKVNTTFCKTFLNCFQFPSSVGSNILCENLKHSK